jgi:citrate lyase subunit beta/citryl-CoA lyase
MIGPAALPACRAHLFAPGSSERVLGKVFDAGADGVVLDLEDAVAPSAKAGARALVAAAVAGRDGRLRPLVSVRINGVDTPWWRDDLAAVVHPALRVVRVPKVESVGQLVAVDAELDALEARRGMAPGSIGVVATIETAAGIVALAAIARGPRLRGFTFGAADFVRDIGADPLHGDAASLLARQHLVLVSRASGLAAPVASVFTAVKDLDGLRRTTEEARALGFFGRSCIHPAQVPVVQDVFTPPPAAVDAARAVVQAWQDAVDRGVAAFTMPDGQFVDEPIARRAAAVVALAAALEEQTSS